MEQTQRFPFPKGMIHHVRPTAAWGQLAQSPETVVELKQACSRFTQGENLAYLFTGQNDDEKFLAAKIIASTVERDLYQVDLSTVLNRYDGETVKNLNRMIQEAEDSGAILFFDEADALFSKRSEVKDSHDRFDNLEAASIIRLFKDYKGFAILAANPEPSREEEFSKHFHHRINFS